MVDGPAPAQEGRRAWLELTSWVVSTRPSWQPSAPWPSPPRSPSRPWRTWSRRQGKSLNQELSRKAKEAAQETTDGALRAFLEALSDEDRAAYAAKVAQMAADIEAAKVTVDVEDGVEEGPAAQAESAEGSAE